MLEDPWSKYCDDVSRQGPLRFDRSCRFRVSDAGLMVVFRAHNLQAKYAPLS